MGAGYGNRIQAKYTAKWGVQIAGMIFQTRSSCVTWATTNAMGLPVKKQGVLLIYP